MQQLQINPPWEYGLISLIYSYLAFCFFHFSTTTLLQLGVWFQKYFTENVLKPLLKEAYYLRVLLSKMRSLNIARRVKKQF